MDFQDDETVKTAVSDEDGDDVGDTTEEFDGVEGIASGTTTSVPSSPPRDDNRNYARAGCPRKEGHSFCGCLCDMKRACIIIDIINIFIAAMAILLFVVAWMNERNNEDAEIDNSFRAANDSETINGTALWTNTTDIDGDEVDDAYEQFVRAWRITLMVILIISVLSFTIGIIGSLRYSAGMVFCTGIWHCFLFTVNMLGLNLLGALVNILFAYPHFVLVHEIRQGIMNRDRYPLEKQSCCCV